MHIISVDPIVVNAEMRNWTFVKVITDEGVVGWGEASLEWKTQGVVGCIYDLRQFIIGLDPMNIEHLYQVMYRQPFFRPGIECMTAISGIEMACWDIMGKALGIPVYKLLGGKVRNKIRMYDHLGGGEMNSLYNLVDSDHIAEKASQSVADGYSAIKVLLIPPSRPLEGLRAMKYVEQVMESVRNSVGDAIDILVDFHGRTTPSQAIRYAKVLEPYSPYFIEEPTPAESIEGLLKVTNSTDIPTASGERLVTRFQFRPLIEKQAVSVVQPDICHCGGLWEAKKIAAMAEAYFIGVAPHNPLGPIATAASLHFAASTPNWVIQESIRADVPWRDEVVIGAIQIQNGEAQIPDLPGLGVEVDEAMCAKYPFKPEIMMRVFHDDGAVADW